MTVRRLLVVSLLVGLGAGLAGCRRAPARDAAPADAPLPAASAGLRPGGPVGAAPAAPSPVVAARDAGVPRPGTEGMAPAAVDAGAPVPAGKLMEGVLELPPASLPVLSVPGAEPRVALRYRLAAGETLRFATRVQQTTLLRSDKTCPAPGAPPRPAHTITSTIPVSYGLDLVTRVARADARSLALETRFEKVSLILPPPLGSQQALITASLQGTAFTTEMTPEGQVRRFQLTQLTGRPLWDDLQRMKTPLGHLQPVFPAEAVGRGARWREVRVLPLNEASGSITARYDTDAEVVSVVPGATGTVEVRLVTLIQVDGKVMGQPYLGSGRVTGTMTLDLRRGIAAKAIAESRVCATVMGRLSENVTRYEQTLVP